VVIGSGGTVGSQDWMQTALIAKAAGINPRDLRYVALEGGGEIATALLGGHPGRQHRHLRLHAAHPERRHAPAGGVLRKRLDEPEMKDIPTAKEQGYDIVWPVVRGFYLGPKSAMKTTPGGKTPSTNCWPPKTSPSCAISANCSRSP
jgi:putative tricarboxylic transport membrane protein